jgi:PAT family beta-lactamase induction signal transducer AmpG
MPALPDHRLARIALLTSLYFAQGLPFGFFTQAFPVILRQRGHDLAEIGLVGLLNLPWALKFLWSPLVDRWQGSPLGPRRGWIVPLQVASLMILLALAQMPHDGALLWVGVAFLLLNVVAATQDIATDALAVNLLRGPERGLGNGVQVGGYRLGMIVGGGFLLVLFTQTGWSGSFAIMAGLMAAASLPVWIFREPAGTSTRTTRAAEAGEAAPLRAAFGHFLRRPGMAAWLLALCIYKAGDAFASSMVRPFLVDLGLALGDVGWLLGTAGSTAALLGAFAGGALLVRLPRRGALLGFGVLQLLSVAVWIIPALWEAPAVDRGVLYAVSIFEHFAGSMATVALFTVMMDACEPERAGTDYTVQACVVVVATGAFGAASGFSARALGFTGHFALATLLCGLGLLGVAALTRRGLMQAPVR